jgi:hypothetical protein
MTQRTAVMAGADPWGTGWSCARVLVVSPLLVIARSHRPLPLENRSSRKSAPTLVTADLPLVAHPMYFQQELPLSLRLEPRYQ